MKVEDLQIFPTTIMLFDLSDELDDMDDLISNYQGTPHALIDNNGSSNYGTGSNGGASDFLIESGNSKLKRLLQKCVSMYTDQMSLKSCIIVNSWMNHIGQNGSVRQHRHEGSVISGALYPKLDEGSVGLTFHSPIKPYRMNDLFIEENYLNTYYHTVEAKQNHLVLFPSWLEHSTEMNKTENRYVLSFNTVYFGLND